MADLHNDEEEEYLDRVNKLSERLSGDDPDERIRRIARLEADKRINAYVGPILFMGALWWAHREYGTQGIWMVLVLGAAWFMWIVLRMDHDPSREQHLVVSYAEDLNRLTIIADAHGAGEPVWSIGEKQYPSDKPSIVATDGPRWDGSWRRVYNWALELERISPRARRKRLLTAAKQARPALEQGEAMAKHEDAELTFWARDYLHKLKRA